MKRPFLLVCGPRGVGKSSVGYQVFLEVMGSGIKAAYVDLNQVSFCRPVPEDDPENQRVKVRNLARIWSVHEGAGARCLIAAGDMSGPAVADDYAAAVPELDMNVCHLDATADTLRERLFARGPGEGPPIPGDELRGASVALLTRLADEAARSAKGPARRTIGSVRIQTDDLSVLEWPRKLARSWAIGRGWRKPKPRSAAKPIMVGVQEDMALVDLHGREDEADVRSLLRLAAGSRASAQEAARRYVTNEWLLIGWEEAGQVVGCVGVSRRDESTLELHSVAVANEWQRRGVGRALMEAMVEVADQAAVVAETDEDGVGFYRSCGFEVEAAPAKAGRARFRCVRPGAGPVHRAQGGMTLGPIEQVIRRWAR